jgi:hypothetical protein
VPDQAVVIGSFTDVERPAEALEQLRALGIDDRDITVMSSVPYATAILGRPQVRTPLSWISLAGAVLGLVIGVFFVVITPYLYVIRVGGQPISPTPPALLLLYEFAMLFLIAATFGGLLFLNRTPGSEPEYYDPHLSDGRIALVVHYPAEKKAEVVAVLEAQGAGDIGEPERRKL